MKVSVIVPVYNVARYLGECLDSVAAASRAFLAREADGDVELVCVDDGSTDGADEVLERFAQELSGPGRRPSFRAVRQANAGVGAARNAGLALASGDWVWFVDGDDVIHPEALTVLSESLRENPDVDFVRLQNHLAETLPARWGRVGGEVQRYRRNEAARLAHGLNGASQYLIRRSVVGGLRFEPYRWLEDVLFVMRCLKKGGDMLEIPDVLYFYRKREGSAIHSQRTREQVAEIFQATDVLVSVADEVMGGFPDTDWRPFLKCLHPFAYFAFHREYFALCASDRQALLDDWLALQDRFVGRYPMPLEWRVRLALVRFFHSGLLVTPLVLWGASWRGRVARLVNKARTRGR